MISTFSTLYGFGDMLAFWYNDEKIGAPFSLTIWGSLATIVDCVFRAFFMSYIFSIIKIYAFLVPITYVIVMLILLYIKNQFQFKKPVDTILAVCMSFGCSAIHNRATCHFDLRIRSKIVFGLIFLTSLSLITYLKIAALPFTTDTSSVRFDSEECLNICSKNETFKEFCANLWKDTEPQTHMMIVISLSVVFLLSIIEGVLDMFVSFMPYKKLQKIKKTPIEQQPLSHLETPNCVETPSPVETLNPPST